MNLQQEKEVNPYTIALIYDKKNRSFENFVEEFKNCLDGEEDLLYIKPFLRNDNQGKDQTYVVAIKKYFNDRYSNDENFKAEKGFSIKRYHPDNRPINKNMTYGFFIKTDEIRPETILSIFQKFEATNFLIKDSYEIIFPRPYPNGNERNYLIVTFHKIGDNLPKKFIRKLKFLLDRSIVNGYNLRVNWLSNSVKNDIIQGENKELKIKN